MKKSMKEFLLKKGVKIMEPETVYVDEMVSLDRISTGVTVYPGCRLIGEQLAMGAGCVIGEEGPATLKNCQLSTNVKLKGGFFEESVFLHGSSTGSEAHVRPGCLLEEESNVAHGAGLKQTILMSFVTGGSLLNFCDVLMAGGRSRSEHSEIGSSYIHFNFTPHGDKATASLVGDVPHGVLLDNAPIFLGGQGGLVGPSKITYGVVIPAGQIFRGNAEKANHVCTSATPKKMCFPYDARVYKKINRLVRNNLDYVGNIYALREWYKMIRQPIMQAAGDGYCYEGALRVLKIILNERLKRLDQLKDNLERSIKQLTGQPQSESFLTEQCRFVDHWDAMKERIECVLDSNKVHDECKQVQDALCEQKGKRFTDRIHALTPDQKTCISDWLSGLVKDIVSDYTSVTC